MKRFLTLIAVGALNLQLQAQVSFTLSDTVGVGAHPLSVAEADVNGDGKPDLITANRDGDTLSVLTNDGSGGFVASGTYAVGTGPSWVVAADVNGDGKPDLICVNYYDNTLSVLTNDGSGGFVVSGTYAVGSNPHSLSAADVNGDGKVDLISANSGDNTLSVLTNNGSGGFVTSGTYAVGNTPLSVTAGDVNGDGRPDLISANYSDSTISMLTNNGSGGFVVSGTYAVGNNPLGVTAADVNGDGKVDLISANNGGSTISVVTNNGSGGFATSGTYAVGNVWGVAVADVNGDGSPDLICANYANGTLSVLTNNGSGKFATAATMAAGSNPSQVIAVDVNGDGKPDLVCANEFSYTVSVLLNTTTFPPTRPKILSQPQSQSIPAGAPVSFTVSATGSAPLSYQWQFYGTNIFGATNATLAFASAQPTNAGLYSVLVTNSLGFTNSAIAVLQVLPTNAPSLQVNGQLAVGTISVIATAQVTIAGGFPSGYLFYTLDGTTPSANSTLYAGAFTLTNFATVRAMSLSADFSQTAFAPAVQVQVVAGYNLQTSVVGSGTLTVSPPTGPYLSNSVVTLTAIPATNWFFAYWTNGATGNQNPLSVTMNQPQSVQAVFLAIPLYSLQTSVVGNGTLTVSPPTGPYLSNTVVTLTAKPATNWLFAFWTNSATGNQNPLSLTMNGPQNVAAVFLAAYPVTVSTPGGGSVTVNGQVIAPATLYPAGSVLTLAATPTSGWNFLGWQGSASGTNNPLSVTVNGTNNIQAIFATVVGTNALGGGQIVLSQPNPIPFGATVTASAVPNAGLYFATWFGAASGTNAPTQFTVTSANPTINGLFSTLPGGTYSLGVVVMGNGSVAVSPQQDYYNAGTRVNLSATPVPGVSSFYGWTEGAAGTNSSLAVVMNSNLTVQANFGVVPIVSISPLNLFVVAGSNAVLTASAGGLPPLRYQWQNGQGGIAGATNASFTIHTAQPTNSGNYFVVVSNAFGSVTSAVATVTVGFPPGITLQPTNQLLAAGNSLTLAASASGTTPLNYQWQDSSGPLPGQTNSSLILNPALTNYTDNYSVVVASPYGTATSQVATVLVYLPVSISIPPASAIVSYLAPATFGVTATGFPAPNTYQWLFNGTNLPGATSNSLTINNVMLANTGSYQVQVGNGYSATTSQSATLNMAPSLTSPFSGVSAISGASASLSVGAIGNGMLSYQWYFNGVAINGATAPALNFASIQLTNAGLYSVVVSSAYGSVTNAGAQVVVIPGGISLGFYPGLTITGVVNFAYIIQSSTNLANPNGWTTLTNLILQQSEQLWIDTSVDASSPFNPRVFYKVLPGQ